MKKFLAILLISALIPLAARADDTLSPKAQALMDKASKGDGRSAFNLAVCFHEGDGCPQSDSDSAKWLRVAADHNDVQALLNLGNFYHKGVGVKQDDAQALQWYRQAAARGSAEAEYNIGTFYAAGTVVKEDVAMAKQWYERAGNQGLVEAQMTLAELAMQSTPPDYQTAYFWFAVAAKSDDDAATYRDRVEKTLSDVQLNDARKKVASWRPQAEQAGFDANRGLHP